MTKDKNIIIKNIYYMLSYAYKSLQAQDCVDVEAENFENIYDLFAAILTKGVANQVKKGLNKEYIEETEALGTLRGKIDITASIKRQTMVNRKLVCVYDEFTENSYMNRILKSVAFALIGFEEVRRDNKNALKKVMLSFSNVEKLELAAINWSSLKYHRNNATYKMLMNICYLTVNKLLLTTESGDMRLSSFLDEQKMHKLYEKFILEYYKTHFPEYNPAAKQIPWDVEGTIDFLPIMQSDIMISKGEKTLIIDAKYYSRILQKQYDKEKFHSQNIYQIFTYVKNMDVNNTGNVSGMLLYAKTDESIDLNENFKAGGNSFSVMTLDLSVEFSKIREQLNNIISINFCPLSHMISFEFSIGGYFAESHYVFIDGKKEQKVMRYAQSPDGMFVDLKHPENYINFNSEIAIKEMLLSSEKWLSFAKEIDYLEITSWNNKYYDNDICDGTQWRLEISFSSGNKISKCGSNQYPSNWNKFINVMRKYIDKNIV
jgi:5-methylcytosine-specific restriction enzyme subunit McrC